MYSRPTFKDKVNACTTCKSRQFAEIAGGVHGLLFESLTVKKEFNNFINSH
jgi:hypothetical protein